MAAQVSQPGATHLDAREVVVSVYPSKLDGIYFEARIRHKKKWHHFRTRLNPESVGAWLKSVDGMPAPTGKPEQSPVLAGMNGTQGIVLVRSERGDRHWVLQQLDNQPLHIQADRKFSDTLLVALRAAVPLSGIDSAAFASGLVPPLVPEADSCAVSIIHIPTPKYPAQLAMERIQGRVEMRYIVQADGRIDPASIEALWASHAEFIPPAAEALKQGRFRPAVLNGQPISRQVYQAISFREQGKRPRWN